MAGRLSIIVVAGGDPQTLTQALESVSKGPEAQRLVAGNLEAEGVAAALAGFDGFEQVPTADGPAPGPRSDGDGKKKITDQLKIEGPSPGPNRTADRPSKRSFFERSTAEAPAESAD